MGEKSSRAGHSVQIGSHVSRCQSMTMTAMTVGGIYFCRMRAIYRANIIYIYIIYIYNIELIFLFPIYLQDVGFSK